MKSTTPLLFLLFVAFIALDLCEARPEQKVASAKANAKVKAGARARVHGLPQQPQKRQIILGIPTPPPVPRIPVPYPYKAKSEALPSAINSRKLQAKRQIVIGVPTPPPVPRIPIAKAAEASSLIRHVRSLSPSDSLPSTGLEQQHQPNRHKYSYIVHNGKQAIL